MGPESSSPSENSASKRELWILSILVVSGITSIHHLVCVVFLCIRRNKSNPLVLKVLLCDAIIISIVNCSLSICFSFTP